MTFFSIENTLKSFENYLTNEGQRQTTKDGNTRTIKHFLSWLETENIAYNEVNYKDLLVYVNDCKNRGNTPRTINGKLVSIKHFYNHLQKEKQVKYNPCEELRIRGEIKRVPHDLLSWEELQGLYQNYPNANITGKRNKTILGIMIYQGINSGEVAALEVKDVKLEEAKIYIPSRGRSNSRTLKLESVQILQLQKYITEVRPIILAISGKESERLFISTGTGKRLDNSLKRLIRHAKKINEKVKTTKQIRASVITYWLNNYSLREVQYMAGHRYVSSTEKYRTDNLETLQGEIDKLHPLD